MNENDLVVKKTIQIEQKKVFEAWIDPASMARWCCPIAGGHSEVECDAREGGKFKIDMISPDGETVPHWGVYQTVDPHNLLEFSWNSPHATDTMVRVEFKAISGGTEITLIHSGLPTDKARSGHRDGWNSILNRFADNFATVN
ncbi:MAG: SRPBCC domain-containing protein [Leptospiraceae bacterium]|nr:SRPBCC domain-containing protein [Leptospiraceae bacterium]MCB1304848.1 SRPBCC domain-containing protein [Leptospiraceae bacterium]